MTAAARASDLAPQTTGGGRRNLKSFSDRLFPEYTLSDGAARAELISRFGRLPSHTSDRRIE